MKSLSKKAAPVLLMMVLILLFSQDITAQPPPPPGGAEPPQTGLPINGLIMCGLAIGAWFGALKLYENKKE